MALNIKDPTTEQLAAQLAALTHDTKTGAIRTALEERLRRLERLLEAAEAPRREERLRRLLVDEIWPQIPMELRGQTTTKEQREAILGIGAEGV